MSRIKINEKKNFQKASLVIVGSGIKFISHLTTEAKAYIIQSEKVLYLVNEPAMKEWIIKSNSNSESLDDLYNKFSLRLDCYHAITEYILKNLYSNIHLCVVFYGHPTVFAQPGLDAAIQAKQEGYNVKILPGISAEDCLFADLLIDPGSSGCQSFEATDFLVRHRVFDINSHLVLWQIASIGVLTHNRQKCNKKNITILADYLMQFYDPDHGVVLYEAAQYPHFEPKIEKIFLRELPKAKLSRISTLYISPVNKSPCDLQMLKSLSINVTDLLIDKDKIK